MNHKRGWVGALALEGDPPVYALAADTGQTEAAPVSFTVASVAVVGAQAYARARDDYGLTANTFIHKSDFGYLIGNTKMVRGVRAETRRVSA